MAMIDPTQHADVLGPRFLQKGAGPKHYRATGAARIHRLRAEQALGKPLPQGAVVHHADGTLDPLGPLVICQNEPYHKLLHLRMKIVTVGGDPNTDKVCSVCSRAKPLDAFARDRQGPLGRQRTCRECARVRMKAKYDANPEYYRAKTRAYRATHC